MSGWALGHCAGTEDEVSAMAISHELAVSEKLRLDVALQLGEPASRTTPMMIRIPARAAESEADG
jgi:hypothetical protein